MGGNPASLVEGVVDARLDDGEVVLELGCGKSRMADCHPRHVGVDRSRTTLAPRIDGPGSFVQTDIQQLPVEGATIGFIFTIDALEHVPRPERVLREIERILRPAGYLLLDPAWFCRPWFAEALGQKPYHELNWTQRPRKGTVPLRNSIPVRACRILPRRLWRELRFSLSTEPLDFRYSGLEPNLDEYLRSDSDAFSWMDPHEAMMYFLSRNYEVIRPNGNFPTRLLVRHEPLLLRKPSFGGRGPRASGRAHPGSTDTSRGVSGG